jgi:predicted O-methyltransferase YrrM
MNPMSASSVDARLVAETAMSIPGMMSRDECEFLFSSALDSGPNGTFLEVGAWQGRSTFVLCSAARKCGACLFSVDNFSAPERVRYTPSSPETLLDNLSRFGIQFRGLLPVESRAAAERVPGKLTLLFLDGDHGEGPLQTDLDVWTPRLRREAIVLFHDYGAPRWPAVAVVADRWRAANPVRVAEIGMVDRLAAFRWTAVSR